jgi:tetratricopeptide (TPR) repeat protein
MNKIIKFSVAAASLAYMIWEFYTGHWGIGIAMLIPSAILVFACTRSTRMMMVFYFSQLQKIEKAKKWLDKIKESELWPNQRGYYFFLKGSMEAQSNSIAESERYMKKALELGLKRDEDKAMIYLQLASLSLSKGKIQIAKNHIATAKNLDAKGMLKNEIKQVEKYIKSGPQVTRRSY